MIFLFGRKIFSDGYYALTEVREFSYKFILGAIKDLEMCKICVKLFIEAKKAFNQKAENPCH